MFLFYIHERSRLELEELNKMLDVENGVPNLQSTTLSKNYTVTS